MTSRAIALILLAVGFSYGGGYAAQSPSSSPISFSYLKAITPGEYSALSGECDGTTASPEITCRFTQVGVRYQLDPKDAPAELNKRLAQLRSEAARDPKKFGERMCFDTRSRAEIERRVQEIKNPRTKQRAQEFIALCANPSIAALEQWTRRSTIAETRTCKVSAFQNETVTYKKTGPNKWVANVGPKGLCSSVYLYTMENDVKHWAMWKWSQVRTYADTSQEFCKDLQLNHKLEYSGQGENPDISCDGITFGF